MTNMDYITPITRISLPAVEAAGNRVFVKRDDLLPFSFGGNKVRIAREFLADMRARACDALVMYGDLQSNLCRVLACLCHQEHIPSLMVATAHQGETSTSNNERMIRRLGIDIIRCAKDNIAAGVDTAMERLRAQGLHPYYIYGNRYGTGNEGVAARAYERAYHEICRQERALGLSFGLIATPYGTGCTQGGLICGSLQDDDGRHIVGISISSRTPQRAREVLETTVLDWFDKAGAVPPRDWRDHIDLQARYTRGGYGQSDERVNKMVEFMLTENALPTDPTYTAKALLGLVDYLTDQDIRNTDVLFIHTGGLPLFFDYLSQHDAAACAK